MASNETEAGSQKVEKLAKIKSNAGLPLKTQPPRLKVEREGDTCNIEFDEADGYEAAERMLQVLGTRNSDFASRLVSQLSAISMNGGEPDAETLNFCLSVIADLQPRDQVETMLAAQMAAVHTATMTFARRLNHVETIEQQDSAEKTFNKLTRSFTSQMEALRKYRNGGEQKVTIQHVNVNEGGQAVVGNINQSKSTNGKNS